MRPGPFPRRRPPWWPADQPWPPRGGGPWRGGRGFLLRMGCLLAVVLGFAATAVAVAAWLTAGAIGYAQAAPRRPPLVVVVIVLVAVLAGFAGTRTVRRLVWPLRDLVAAAGRIEAGDYSVRVPEQGPPELVSVARAFNAMTARLRATEERRRGFLADVTHELRTPLAVILGQSEAIADGVYPGDPEHLAPIVDAARALEVLTEDLRTLALSDAGSLTLSREPVDLAALAQDTLAAFQAQAGAAGIALRMEPGAEAIVAEVDPTRVGSVLRNLVSNALRHTPAGGTVSAGVRSRGDAVELTVADTGSGIPRELLPHVFERFVKGPGSRGSGLGLAIARDIVTAHRGTIDVDSEQGAGTTVRIRLPAAPR